MLGGQDIIIELTEDQFKAIVASNMFNGSAQSDVFMQYTALDVQLGQNNTLRVTMSIDPKILTLNMPKEAKNVTVSSCRIAITFDLDLNEVFGRSGVKIIGADPNTGVIKIAVPLQQFIGNVAGVERNLVQQIAQEVAQQAASQAVAQVQQQRQQSKARIITQ